MQVGIFDEGRLGVRESQGVRDITDWAFAHSALRTHDPMLALIDAMRAGGTPQGSVIERSAVRWRARTAPRSSRMRRKRRPPLRLSSNALHGTSG